MSEFEVSAADIAAKSDQLNADDLVGGPLVATITRVTRGQPDQPWNVHLDRWPHPWRPSKGQRRLIVELFGPQSQAWIGRTIRLYREPSVTWGGQAVGGIRLSGASGLDAPRTCLVTVARGKKAPQLVEPIDAPRPATKRGLTLEAVTARLRDRGLWDAAVERWGDGLDGWDLAAVVAWAREQAERVEVSDG